MRRLLMLTTLLLAAGAAFAGPNPNPNTLPYPSQTTLSLNHSNVFFSPQVSSPPIQFQNQGTPLGVSFTFNCSTGMSCSFVNGVMTVTSTGGSGTINSCGMTNAIAQYTAATTIGCDANTTDASGAWTYATAGALSTPVITLTGAPITGGSGTTTVPLFYFNSGASAPSTWNTNGTVLGINAVSGYTGNFLDFRINGGVTLFNVSSSGIVNVGSNLVAGNNIVAGANNTFSLSGKSAIQSASNGELGITNNAGNGFTRLTLGTDTTAFPALCPITGTTPYLAFDVAGACTTGTFVKTAQTLQVTASDFTCSTGCTSLATITGLSVALPTVATNWSFTCDLIIDQATAAATDQIGVQTATNASTNLAATAIAYTAAAVSTSGSLVGASSTTSQSVLTFTPGATGTNLPLHLAGTVEGTSTSGTTLNIQILTGSSSDAITVKRGSSCYVY